MSHNIDKLCEVCIKMLQQCTTNWVSKMAAPLKPGVIMIDSETYEYTGDYGMRGRWLYRFSHPHHMNLSALESSAAQGCHLCSLIRRHMPLRGTFDESLPIFIKHMLPDNESSSYSSKSAWRILMKPNRVEVAVRFHRRLDTHCEPN